MTNSASCPLETRLYPRPSQMGAVAVSTQGMVVTSHPQSALTGHQVLQRGGNAVDAAIAIAAAETVLLPMCCGIGGDAFIIHFDASSGRLTGINGSGAAPKAANRQFFLERGHTIMPEHGPLAFTVPGAVDAYWSLWKQSGKLDWTSLWQPAIRFAGEGVPLTERMGARVAGMAPTLSGFPTSAKVWLPGGSPPRPGDVHLQNDLATSLRRVAEGGADAYYRGDIARRIVEFTRSQGGLFTEEEFAAHRSEIYRPLWTNYRGYDVYETAPPSQGFLVLEALNLLEGFDLAGMGLISADAIHTMAEAKKLAFADRLRHCADPRFHENPLPQLLSKPFAAQRRKLIDPERAATVVVGTEPEDLDHDTTYFCVVDRDGNAVSFIHSLFGSFGSCLVAGDTGIMLNNRGKGFSLEEGHVNAIEPGKRTMHTLNCYMICKDGKPWVVGGTPGGDQQPQWNMQIITDLVDHGLNVQAAAEAPRWHSIPGTTPDTVHDPFELVLEDRIAPGIVRALEGKGHAVSTIGPWNSGGCVQLIMLDQERGLFLGGTDPRASGLALGL